MQVTILLNRNIMAMLPGSEVNTEADSFVEAITFEVPEERTAACEVAFAVCNSAPGELFCDPQYADVVERYRTNGHRSLSVGDVVKVGEVFYRCCSVGFAVTTQTVTTVELCLHCDQVIEDDDGTWYHAESMQMRCDGPDDEDGIGWGDMVRSAEPKERA